MDQSKDIATIDLGSNSFHMLIVRPRGKSFIVVERLKEKVQLLKHSKGGRLDELAQARGLDCLRRFAQRLKSIDASNTVIMGTYALRAATNARMFLDQAEQILGMPIEIISGDKEARLIYQAVAHNLGNQGRPRLVIDIGGGSTEVALGRQQENLSEISANIGCVSFNDRFFDSPRVTPSAFDAAKSEAKRQLEMMLDQHPQLAGELDARKFELGICCGTSGTIESIYTVLQANGWIGEDITAQAVQRLEAGLVDDRWVIEAGIPGLPPERVDIFPAGVAILTACFEVFGLQAMRYVDVSLLHGMVCGKLYQGEVEPIGLDGLCADSVNQLAKQYAINEDQAQRVSSCALALFDQVPLWFESEEAHRQNARDLLKWAAQLHEVGMEINAQHYHRHGAYIVKHAQLPGFTLLRKNLLALLIRSQRRAMPGLAFSSFGDSVAQFMLRLVVLLRIAVILHRSHSDADLVQPQLQVDGSRLKLFCGDGWLHRNPLSAKELEFELQQLDSAGLQLNYV